VNEVMIKPMEINVVKRLLEEALDDPPLLSRSIDNLLSLLVGDDDDDDDDDIRLHEKYKGLTAVAMKVVFRLKRNARVALLHFTLASIGVASVFLIMSAYFFPIFGGSSNAIDEDSPLATAITADEYFNSLVFAVTNSACITLTTVVYYASTSEGRGC
jgi:hypothetical protein